MHDLFSVLQPRSLWLNKTYQISCEVSEIKYSYVKSDHAIRGITLNLFWRVWAGRVHVPGAGGVRAARSAVWRGVRLHGRVGRADLSTPPQEEEEGYAPLLPAPVLSVKSVPVLNMWTSRNPESCPFWYFRGEAADICTHRVDKSAKPFLQSLELGLLHPVTRRRVCPPPFRSGRGGEAGEGVGGPNSDAGTYTVVLYVSTYPTVFCLFFYLDNYGERFLWGWEEKESKVWH